MSAGAGEELVRRGAQWDGERTFRNALGGARVALQRPHWVSAPRSLSGNPPEVSRCRKIAGMERTRFRSYAPDQLLLLPPDLREWLPEGHAAYFILDVLDGLDLSEIYASYDGSKGGRPGFDPRLLTGLLLYGYCQGVASSRKIEKATYESVPFRVLAANQHPDHDTIAEFRRRHLSALSGLFVQRLTSLPEGRSGKAGPCGVRRHEGKGQCLEAQGDELRTDERKDP